MPGRKGSIPWNKGIKTEPWSEEKKKRHSLLRKGKGIGPRPQQWKWGTDRDLRDKNTAFLKARCQAKYRQEEGRLTFPEYDAIWNENDWARRGIQAHCICMSRDDMAGPWSKKNVILIERGKNARRLHNNLDGGEQPAFEHHGRKFTSYHDMVDHYNISYQTARNWRRFNKGQKK
jgi:hypothetical protein